MKTNNKPEIHYHITFNGPVGQHIDHIERQYVCFDKDMKMQTLSEPVQPSQPAVNPVIEQLLPIFWDDKEAATAFFLDINKESPQQITRRINALVKEGKMNQKLCKQVLWTVLHQAQIYPYSYQNWCKQIN